MRSVTTSRFRREFAKLPEEVRARAKEAYRLWLGNPFHPGLHFKRIHPVEPIYSVRIGMNYRAVALVEDDLATWNWIGSHAEYNRLRSSL